MGKGIYTIVLCPVNKFRKKLLIIIIKDFKRAVLYYDRTAF